MALDAGQAARIPIVFCVDVEPFARHIEEPDPHWHGTPETFERVEAWRRRFAEATAAPVHFTWLWRADPAVADVYGAADWGLVRYRDVWEAAVERGDEQGVHPHLYRRGPSGSWISDFRDPRWAEHCIRMSIGEFERHLGRRPRVIRFGDQYMSARAARFLSRLGLQVDLTIEPGLRPVEYDSNVPAPDYTQAHSRPYRPARTDFLRARRKHRDGHGLMMLPLTTAAPSGDGSRRVFHPWDDPAVTASAVDALLDEGQPYLAFAIRTSVYAMGPTAANTDALLAHLAGHPLAHRFAFVTPGAAVEMLLTR